MAHQILLFHEPQVLQLQLLLWVREGKVEMPYQLWDQLGDFQEADVAPNTGPASDSKLVHTVRQQVPFIQQMQT